MDELKRQQMVYQAVPELRPRQPGLQSAVRWEAVAPGVERGELSALASRYATNDKLIDGMLSAHTTPSQRQDVHRDLGILPTPLLRHAHDLGVRIWVAPRGARELPHRFCPAEVDPAALGRAWDHYGAERRAHQQNHAKHGAPPTPPPAFKDRVMGAGETLETRARAHGARTPQQGREFLSLTQRMYRAKGLPFDAKASLKWGDAWVPDLYYYQGQRYTCDTALAILDTNESLHNPKVAGEFNSHTRLVMVKEAAAAEPTPDWGHHRTILHEFGHVADWMMGLDPQRADAHRDGLQSVDAADQWDRRFITGYAAFDVAEHYADGMEAYWTTTRGDGVQSPPSNDADYGDFPKRDPRLLKLLEAERQMWEHDEVHPQSPQRHP